MNSNLYLVGAIVLFCGVVGCVWCAIKGEPIEGLLGRLCWLLLASKAFEISAKLLERVT